MTNPLDIPFNLSILVLSPEVTRAMRPVRSQEIFDGLTHTYHPDGLYSLEIFGKVGDRERKRRFSYIDIKVPVIHPAIYKRLIGMRALYRGILSNTEYAVWDVKTKDFAPSNQMEGRSGYDFFIEHWAELKIEDTGTDERRETIRLFDMFKHISTTDTIAVMPAGYRDLEEDERGFHVNEINDFYRRILSYSNAISESSVRVNPKSINDVRYKIQVAFVELYDYIENMIKGKKKLAQAGFASRRTFNGTRNVLSSMVNLPTDLTDPQHLSYNHTQVGLVQLSRALLPVTQFQLQQRFIKDRFFSIDQPALLVNRRTLKREPVRLKSEIYDYWTSSDGHEKVIARLLSDNKHNKPIVITDHYLALVYSDEKCFKVFDDIDDLPDGWNRENVRPITLGEMIYLCLFDVAEQYPFFVTRYPVTGVGSIYPSYPYLLTTETSRKLKQLDDEWQITDKVAREYPIVGLSYVNTMIPHPARIKGMGADFDGDTGNGVAAYTDDAILECKRFMRQRRAYIGTDGAAMASISNDTLELVLFNLSGLGR